MRGIQPRADAFIARHNIPVLFLTARWCLYADFATCLAPVLDVIDKGAVDQSAKRDEFAAMLTGTVNRLAGSGRTIWLVQPVPEYPFDVPTAMATALLRGVPTRTLDLPRDNISPRMPSSSGSCAVWPTARMCARSPC